MPKASLRHKNTLILNLRKRKFVSLLVGESWGKAFAYLVNYNEVGGEIYV